MKFKTINPATEQVISEYEIMPIEKVMDASKKVSDSSIEWKKLDISEHNLYFRKLAGVLRKNKKEYAKIITTEMGKPISQSITEVEKCAWTADVYADNAEKWLEEELKDYKHDGEYCKKVKKELEKKLFIEGVDDNSFPMRPRRIVSDCRKALGKEDIICMDNGIYKLWFSRHYKTYDIGTFLIDNALATMGAGLPSAIISKMIYPNKKVLAVVGDGGFMMNSQELETAVRLGLNVVVLILNDNGYGFIKWKKKIMKFDDYALDLGNPDFVKYAESYGAKGIKVNKANDLIPALKKAFEEKCPVLIECPIDYSENITTWVEELDSITCPI